MTQPLVDLVIAVHDPARPVLRAVDSVLGEGRADVRVTVVCHGIEPARIGGLSDRVAEYGDQRLRAAAFTDGVRSPAGPFNHGLSIATGEFVGVMGSDDWLAPGALDAWAQQAKSERLDIVLAGLAHQSGEQLRNPPVRPWRRNGLDPVRDRLFHRSAPLGIIRRSLVETGVGEAPIRFTERLATGEDLAFSAAVLANADRVGVAFGSPRYVIGADAVGRVTSGVHSIETVLAPVRETLSAPWFAQLPARVRESLVTARVRGNVIASSSAWADSSNTTQEGVDALREVMALARATAPRAERALPRADRALLDHLAESGATPDSVARAVAAHRGAGLIDRLLPRSLRYTFATESTPTRYVGYMLARFGS